MLVALMIGRHFWILAVVQYSAESIDRFV